MKAFLFTGEEDEDITFKVTRVRDGRNFAVRYVEAQQHGKTIHLSEYSLQKVEIEMLLIPFFNCYHVDRSSE